MPYPYLAPTMPIAIVFAKQKKKTSFSSPHAGISTTTIHPSPLVVGPYATYDSLTTSIFLAAAVANFKIEPNASWGEQGQKSAQKKSQIKTNITNNINAGVGNERSDGAGGDQSEVPGSNPVQRGHLLSRNPHQDRLSNNNDCHINQDLSEQNRQLRQQVQVVSLLSFVTVSHGPG